MRYWKVVKSKKGAIILPVQPLICPFCGNEMIIHDFRAIYQKSFNFYHCDIHMKCPNCSFWCIFGVPISKEEYEELVKSPLHGRVLKEELIKIYPKYGELLKERLKKLGYW